jgi:hypothetical protein
LNVHPATSAHGVVNGANQLLQHQTVLPTIASAISLSFRAEEARTVADQMVDEEARTIMRRVAMDYDRLAKPAEEQLIDQERGKIDD